MTDCGCLVCGSPQIDRAHIKSRGAGGTWEDNNIVLMCRRHHMEQHKMGWPSFALKYKTVRIALEGRGWQIVLNPMGQRRLVRHDA